jgi:Transglutaminase-like superfamily
MSTGEKVAVGLGVFAVGLLAILGLSAAAAPRRQRERRKTGGEPCCASCECVLATPQARCDAIQRLIRPGEVAHMVRAVPHWNIVDSVGAWLRNQYAARVFRYQADPANCDRWCTPAQTISTGRGDCDDWAIVVCSMLHARGVAADFVAGHLCRNGDSGGHAWVEGRDHQGWFLIEATTGNVIRTGRPASYIPHAFLRPGACRFA